MNTNSWKPIGGNYSSLNQRDKHGVANPTPRKVKVQPNLSHGPHNPRLVDLVEHVMGLSDNMLGPSLHPPDLSFVLVQFEQDGKVRKNGDCFLCRRLMFEEGDKTVGDLPEPEGDVLGVQREGRRVSEGKL